MKKVDNLLMLTGFVIVCGSAGASDLGKSLRVVFEQNLLGLIFIVCGYFLKTVSASSAKKQNKCKIFDF